MTSNDYSYINLSYLQLMADNDPDMVQTMINMLLKELPVELERMKAHFKSKSWQDLRATAHKMKSTLAFVGNEKLTSLNRTIEKYAQQETQLEELPALVGQLEVLIGHVLSELRDARQETT